MSSSLISSVYGRHRRKVTDFPSSLTKERLAEKWGRKYENSFHLPDPIFLTNSLLFALCFSGSPLLPSLAPVQKSGCILVVRGPVLLPKIDRIT
jgi:hypothetical protein